MKVCWVEKGWYPLYKSRSYPWEEDGREDAFLFLDFYKGKLYVDTVPKYDDFCFTHPLTYDGWELEWKISPYLTRDQVNELLEKAAPEAEKIIGGRRVRKCDNGYETCYDKAAKRAYRRIVEIISSYSGSEVHPDDPDDEFWKWRHGIGKYKREEKRLEVCRIGSAQDPYPLYHEEDGRVKKAYLHFGMRSKKLWLDWTYVPTSVWPGFYGDRVWEVSPYLNYEQIYDPLGKVRKLASDYLSDYYPDTRKLYEIEVTVKKLNNEIEKCDRRDIDRWLEERNDEASSEQAVKA